MTIDPIKTEDFTTLYRRAFEQFGASALWSSQAVPNPTAADALAITHVCVWRATAKPGDWQRRSRTRAVPLTKIQTDVLRLLASHRDPESYVAGSTPLNRDAPRYSGDIDVFHDREDRVARAAQEDTYVLQEHGYALHWQRREPAIYTVLAAQENETTKLEWVVDSDFRFFPTMRDQTFGYVLHPIDLATNKVAAAYGRREPRDAVDLLTIHERILPLEAR